MRDRRHLDCAGGVPPDRYDAILTRQSLLFELSARIVIRPVSTFLLNVPFRDPPWLTWVAQRRATGSQNLSAKSLGRTASPDSHSSDLYAQVRPGVCLAPSFALRCKPDPGRRQQKASCEKTSDPRGRSGTSGNMACPRLIIDWDGKNWFEAKGREPLSPGFLRLCHSGSGGPAYLSGIARRQSRY